MLLLAPHHYRAVSLLCAKNSDSITHFPFVEPAGPDSVRLLGTDGAMALALKVNAKHDLTGPCHLKPFLKAPRRGVLEVEAEIHRQADDSHALAKWMAKLDTLMPQEGEDSQPAFFDASKFGLLCKAVEVLGCRFTIHTRPAAASIFELRGGMINDLEAGIAVLMPLKTSLEDLLWTEELTKAIDRFKAN